MPGKDSLHTGVKAVTYRGKGSYILGGMSFPDLARCLFLI